MGGEQTLWRRVVILTVAIVMFTGVGLTTFGVYQADAGKGGAVGSWIGNLFKDGWFGKISDKATKVGEKAKKVYDKAKWGAILTGIGVSAYDIAFNDANFLGSSVGFVVQRVAAWLELLIPPPEQQIFNFEIVKSEDGAEEVRFKDKDRFAYYRFDENTWQTIKYIYYYMMGIFWAGAVIIVGYQANYLMFPSGVQDRITARSIISTMILSALAILFIPFLVGIYSDIAMLFVALFANLVDPEIVVQGLLNYTIDDKLTEAMLKLISLAQHGMIFFIYFMQKVVIMGLLVLFPIIAMLQNFPSKRHLFGLWNREMLTNLFTQPVHALLYCFAFNLMQDAPDVEKIAYSVVLLLAIIPAGAFVREVFQGGGFAQEGAGWMRKMAYLTLSGLGIAGVMNTGKLAMQSFHGMRDAYQQSGLAQPGESLRQSIGNTLRRGFQFSAGAFGGLAGMALAGAPGMLAGTKVGTRVSGYAANQITAAASSPEVRKGLHSVASRLPFLDHDHHRQKAAAYQQMVELPQKWAEARQREEEAAFALRQVDSQISPVFAAKQDHLQAKRNLDTVYQQMEPEERVKARNLLQQHEEAYHRSRPQLIHANQTVQDAKRTYERALADYQAIKPNTPEKNMARQQVEQAYKQLQQTKRAVNPVYRSEDVRSLMKAGYRPGSSLAQYLEAGYQVNQAAQRVQRAESHAGARYEELERTYQGAAENYQQALAGRMNAERQKMHLEKVTGKVIPLPPSGPSVPVRKYRIEPVFTPAPQQAAFRAVSQGNRSPQSSSGTAFRPTFQQTFKPVEPAWFADPVTEKQAYTLEKLGVPANTVKNKGEAHLIISSFKKGEDGSELQRRFRNQ